MEINFVSLPVIEILDADHSLETNDVQQTIIILGSLVKAYQEFLAQGEV